MGTVVDLYKNQHEYISTTLRLEVNIHAKDSMLLSNAAEPEDYNRVLS